MSRILTALRRSLYTGRHLIPPEHTLDVGWFTDFAETDFAPSATAKTKMDN